MTHQNAATSCPGTRADVVIPHHATRSQSLSNTSPAQQSSQVLMETADTDDRPTKLGDEREGLTIKLATPNRATKQGDQLDCQPDKLTTPDGLTKKGDIHDCRMNKLTTTARSTKGGDELVSLAGKMTIVDDATKRGYKLVNLKEKFPTFGNDSTEGGKCDNLMDEGSTTGKFSTEGEKGCSLTDKFSAADKDITERGKCDTLNIELLPVIEKPREGQRDNMLEKLATTGRKKRKRVKKKRLSNGLATADKVAKSEGKIDGLTDKLAVINRNTEGGDNSDDLTNKFAGMNLDGWKNFHQNKNEVYNFVYRRPNGKTSCIPWHHGPKEEVIIWGNSYSPFQDNIRYLLGLSALMSLHLNQTSEQIMISPNADTRYLLSACNCGRYHQIPGVTFSWEHNDLQPLRSDVCGNGFSPCKVPTLIDQMSPSFVASAPSVGSHRQPSHAALSTWANPYVQFELPFNHHMKSFWFHGTDFEHALNIISTGVNLELGRNKRQFSNGFGFYLSDNFEHARWWACRENARRPTVIVFKLSFNFHKYAGLNLAQNEQDWQDIVKFCLNDHSKYSFKLNNSLEQRYNSCDYVYGPVLKRRPEYSDYSNWIPIGFQGPCRQLCVRSVNLAKILGREEHIDSVRTFSTQR